MALAMTETPVESSADNRYDELLEAVNATGAEARKLVWDLDAVVGARLSECRDAAVAEALGGVVIEGKIRLPGASIDTWGVMAEVLPAQPRNPSFDDCPCNWGRTVWEDRLSRERDHQGPTARGTLANGERLHEILLALDGPEPLPAATELLVHLVDERTPRDLGFESIIAEHNWRDPVAMREFANTIDYVWEIFLRSDQ